MVYDVDNEVADWMMRQVQEKLYFNDRGADAGKEKAPIRDAGRIVHASSRGQEAKRKRDCNQQGVRPS